MESNEDTHSPTRSTRTENGDNVDDPNPSGPRLTSQQNSLQIVLGDTVLNIRPFLLSSRDIRRRPDGDIDGSMRMLIHREGQLDGPSSPSASYSDHLSLTSQSVAVFGMVRGFENNITNLEEVDVNVIFDGLNIVLDEVVGIYDEQIQYLEEQIRMTSNSQSEAILEGLDGRKYLFDKSKAIGEEEICSICLDEFVHDEHLVKLDCDHCYHSDCIRTWLVEKNECPICRKIAIPS